MRKAGARSAFVLALSDVDWMRWIFAAKTTAAALIALLIAFTFNLDSPQWTLLTVFIVAQPRSDGGILAKSFYRIIGTFTGAAVALVWSHLPRKNGSFSWVGSLFGSASARSARNTRGAGPHTASCCQATRLLSSEYPALSMLAMPFTSLWHE
jgi:hypothetical protein